MPDKRLDQLKRIDNYAKLIQKASGRAVRPYREDGFVNVLNKYGTKKDPQENYRFEREPVIPDDLLTEYYEGNGLFARIIDAPSEEAVRHGFELEGIENDEIKDFIYSALDELDWEETGMTSIKWARLFGGAIAVMLINDGRGLEEPVDWKNIESVDDIRIYDRSVITPDYSSMYSYDPTEPFSTRGSRLGMPETYYVSSRFGSFTVHDSRCLVFKNGILPENTSNSIYQLWGIPEYQRIHRAIRDAEIAHGTAPKMLDRSVQAIYKMKDLAAVLATEEGENQVIKRLEAIDLARGIMNSITIDNDGEDYDFRQFNFSGVSEVIDTTCNYLSALTNIPQSVLFGRSPAGMNSTGHSDMENYYNFVERIQKRMLRSNLRYLISILLQAGMATGEIDEVPDFQVKFNPLWSMSEQEQVALEQQKAAIQSTKAQTAATYVQLQVIDPTEIRRELAKSDDFNIETMLDDYDDEEDLFANMPQQQEAQAEGMMPQGMPAPQEEPEEEPSDKSPEAAPEATKLPQDMDEEAKEEVDKNLAKKAVKKDNKSSNTPHTRTDGKGSVGVIVVKNGKILTGKRLEKETEGQICGPGGHIEKGETPEQAAIRETQEEFGITPVDLIPLKDGPEEKNGLQPYLFLCTEYKGRIKCDNVEMTEPKYLSLNQVNKTRDIQFKPFTDGIDVLAKELGFFRDDEEPASWVTINGNHIPLNSEGKAIGGQPKAIGKGTGSTKKHEFRNKAVKEQLDKVVEHNKLSSYTSPDSFSERGKTAKEARKNYEEEGFELIENADDFSLIPDDEGKNYIPKVDVFSPELTYEECDAATCIANDSMWGMSKSRYIQLCRERGIEPRLHSEPTEAPEWYTMTKSGKQRRDDTPVYTHVGVENLLSDEEINGYAGASGENTEEQQRKLDEAAEKAVSEMTNAERTAVAGYTSQYGYGAYYEVNGYLAGKNPNASQQTKDAAEAITTALDHEIGEDCVTYRGTGEIVTVTQSDELQKIVDEVSKNNFSHAGKLVEGLEGHEFESPTVISASSHQDSNYGQRPIQIIYKTPAKAKAVDVSSISKYGGGRSEVEKALAKTGLFGSVQNESEVAYKPGTRYKVEKVVCSAGYDNKGKAQGKIFVVCTVLTGNEDSAEKSRKNTENSLTNEDGSVTITPQKNNIDGAPKNNKNAAGPHKTKSVKATSEQRKTIRNALKGVKTVKGIDVKGASGHGGDRIAERFLNKGKDLSIINDILTTADITYPGNAPNSTIYKKGDYGVCVGNDSKKVVTVIDFNEEDD